MSFFTPKKINSENDWGEELRQARLFKNLKIEEVSRHLKIRGEYLTALEEERLDQLPAGLYGKNFLKEYALFLGLDHEAILKKLSEKTNLDYSADPFSQKILKKRELIAFPKMVRGLLIGSGVLVCFLYLIFYFNRVVFPPKLAVITPAQNILTTESQLMVSGESEREAEVKINGEIVLNNHGGQFSQLVNLKKGLNNLVITAKKKYSREKTVIRQVIVE